MIVSFHPLAERELNDAAQYYEMESQGTQAEEILLDVDKRFRRCWRHQPIKCCTKGEVGEQWSQPN